MNGLVIIIMILYGGTTLLAGIINTIREKSIDRWIVCTMVSAGMVMFSWVPWSNILILIAGLICIHVGAAGTGKRLNGKINHSHQLVRGFISFGIIIGHIIT